MNEPDEDLESHVPEEPLPERDALLEALVDVETESTPRRRFSKTLIAACVLSGLGVWQIVHVSKGGEPIFQLAAKAMAAPTKLRSDGRAPIGRVLPSTDPIAAYLERAKRGMTDQEIRWMIEDFQTAGLDEEDHSLKGTLRAKQQLWYLEALTEALQLGPEQKNQARARMDELLRKDLEAFEQGIGAVTEVREPTEAIPNDSPIAPNAGAFTWLLKDAYAPWNLCDLSKEQDQLTMHRWRERERISAPKADPINPDAAYEPPPWIQFATTKLDALSGNITELGEDNPYQFIMYFQGMFGRILVFDVFPITPSQKTPASETGLDQARCLQAPQLRMAMLLEPHSALSLINQLDHPIVQQAPAEDPGIMVESPDEPAPKSTSPTDHLPPKAVEPETPVDPVPEPDPK